ncbi:carnosine N-methyltransferase isoform X2 [Sorghum bicolor]|uniref:carnosine N-methyltransferase isoform X2 n=1 Tax=Sorghum bicolor TaxID=4558 RepID=UPI000B4245E0|nr:carnosine N-methyltransferase isoform X2 [Sorghum bicolor]|eukprot:XP_021303566.1 carnosine N-methyltransferase isoform X2 [Sorghum bicolor]
MASHCQPFEEKKNIKQTNDGLSPAIFGSRRLLTHPEKQSTSPPPEKMGERRYTEQEEALEIKSLRRIIAAYANYQDAAERDVKRYERSFKMLPPAHKELLFHLGLKYQRLRWCISMNASFIMNMLEAFEPPFDMSQSNLSLDEQHDSPKEDTKTHESSRETDNKKGGEDLMAGCSQPVGNMGMSQGAGIACNGDKDMSGAAYCLDKDVSASSAIQKVTPRHCTASLFKLNVPPIDVDKVRCIVRNIVRDWGEEGQKERDECYKPILEELNRLFPNRSDQRPPSCLVPGAGLGRLALEISSLGFVSQGNEFSYYMLICSNFILNHTQEANEWTIYPWIHSNCNSLSDNDQLRPVSFPDIHPSSAGITEGFSMCAGDFVEVYSEESQESAWDAVVTCFFLDTAHNIVEYIEIISKVLKDGGVWINLGPLLYHFADSYGPDDDMSIELSLEDVKKVAYHYGFTMEVEKMIETTYTSNMKAMMQNRYHAAFWTMRKDASRSKACKPR